MPPDAFDAQRALAAYIRDPDANAPPGGVEPRRARLYANLFFNTTRGLLAQTFPVAVATLGDAEWSTLVRDFMREHGAQTAVFADLPREFIDYLQVRADAGLTDPPWLRELAHYEWVELALQLSDARPHDVPHDPDGDLRNHAPVLSPLAWPLAYDWPVHRVAPGVIPSVPEPTLLLVHCDGSGDVRFHALAPLAWHLLQRLGDGATPSGEALVRGLAMEAGVADVADVAATIDAGIALLEHYRRDGIILGTRPAS